MQWFFILIFLIGGPIYLFNALIHGGVDLGTFAFMAFLILCALGGAWAKIRKAQVQQGQNDFWRSQRKK
jgi:hypothetical protein